MINALRNLRRFYRLKPAITISVYGTLTDKPMVHVCVSSKQGVIGVYDYPDDDIGNARAEMNANYLSHITGIPLRDGRAEDRWELRGDYGSK